MMLCQIFVSQNLQLRPCQRQLNHALIALKSLLIVFSIICYLNADDIFFPIFTLSSVHHNKSFLLLCRFMWMRLHIPWSVWMCVENTIISHMFWLHYILLLFTFVDFLVCTHCTHVCGMFLLRMPSQQNHKKRKRKYKKKSEYLMRILTDCNSCCCFIFKR